MAFTLENKVFWGKEINLSQRKTLCTRAEQTRWFRINYGTFISLFVV
jgi:hypothetical protein